VQVEFSTDELILTLVSLIRAVNPAMLRQGSEGFTVNFEWLENKPSLDEEEQLLLKIRAALETSSPENAYGLELSPADGRRLSETLGRLESMQNWPADVLVLSQKLRARLDTLPPSEA